MNFRLALLVVLALSVRPLAQVPKKPSPPSSKPVESAETIYRNPTLGFRYRIPYGWVERTKEMQEGDDAAKGEVLLSVFERPPQLKRAEDFLGTLTELTAAQGFKVDGDPSEALIDSQRLVRADFSKPRSDKLTMHQSTLVLLTKGQIVSFTFLADSADGVNDLIDGLGFSVQKSKAK